MIDPSSCPSGEHQRIRVTREDGQLLDLPVGTLVRALPGIDRGRDGLPFIAALVNHDLASLSYPLEINSEVRLLTLADGNGWRVYQRSLAFLVAKAMRELFPQAVFSLQHSLGSGLFWSFRNNAHDGISQELLDRLAERMRELVHLNLPIERRKVSFTDALARFEADGERDKLDLLRFRNPPHVVLHVCDGFSDLAHGPLADCTGVLGRFELVNYERGFVLNLPRREPPYAVGELERQPHLFHIYQEHKEWGRILGVDTVGRLNETIDTGEIEAFMRTAEALHEQKLGRIAQQIVAHRDRLRVILIAGPSSAGKTTFAKRLVTHLTVHGLRPLILGTDDYFVGPEQTPRDASGKPDFEHVEAVDLPFFNESLSRLSEGQEIEVPFFNFQTKQREFHGRRMRLAADQLLVVEGIHGLNPLLTEQVPAERKFRIFISALTQLNLDRHNRISTTDNRLMRRMVRDHRYRGHSALATLGSWASVRRGEERWIFPFQREADETFNSALDYELAVLKPKVEPLLMQIKPHHPEYAEARRLAQFLYNFLGVDDRSVPRTSILREYIGGSAFRY
ncbi:MAG: nucleoside kinase [bacterium]|jgi:uridine kinase|nr:nucleoside kinase [bacterium]